MKIRKLYEDDAPALNTHQQHLEDQVLFGDGGIKRLNNYIEKTIGKVTTGKDVGINTTVKIDGAPAVVCWHKFPGYPDDSIALKSFTTGPQNAISSVDDIVRRNVPFNTVVDMLEEATGEKWSKRKKELKAMSLPELRALLDENGISLDEILNNDPGFTSKAGMRDMLEYCLEIAKYIPDGEAWQGDCLFTKGNKREQEILGKNYITFQPNKIVYAFSEDNPGYENVKNADFGIAFHTIYRGSQDNLSQSFRLDPTRINVPSNFYVMSPALKANPTKKEIDVSELEKLYNELKPLEQKLLSDPAYEEITSNKQFITFWQTYENKAISDKKATHIDVDNFINELKEHVEDRRLSGKDKEADSDRFLDLINTHEQTLVNIVNVLNKASDIKMLLWGGYKNSPVDYSTFYRSRTQGYIPASMEGIAMSDDDGNIVKIVDRSSFSNVNRNPDYMSGFEHESLQLKEEAGNKTAVIAWGRMNPPTIGHQKLVDTLASFAQGEKAKLYLSHTQDKKKNPLSYDDKISFAKKAFEPKVEVVDTDLKTIIDILSELNAQGYNKLVYVGGADRIGGKDDILSLIEFYNENPDRSGKQLYHFDSIKPENAGGGDADGDRKKYTYDYVKQNLDNLDLQQIASASLVRECAKQNDFELFSKLVPFNESDSKDLFIKVKAGLGLKEGLLVESGNNNVMNKLRGWLNKYLTDSNIEAMNYRDGDEIYRFRVKDASKVDNDEQYTLDFISNLISKAQDDIKLKGEVDLKDFKVKDIQQGKYENFSRVAETSRKYRDVEMIFTLVDNDGVETQNTFYSCVNTGETKTLVPNKVMKPINNVNYQNLSQYVRDVPLKETLQEILSEAAQDGNISFSGDLEDLIFNGGFKIDFRVSDSIKEFILSNRSAVIDFSEVFGSVALSNSISQLVGNKDTKVTFPTASNEKLLDYKIEYHNNDGSGIAKISAKAGAGGAPSSSSLSDAIIDYYSHNKVPKSLEKGYEFIKWLDKNVTKQAVDKGFANLRDLVIDIANGNYPKWADEDLAGQIRYHEDIIKDIAFLSSNPEDDLSEYVRELQQRLSDEIHGLNLGRLKELTFEKAKAKPELYNTFVKSIKDKLLSSVAVFYLNRDDNLIEQMNSLFREAYGPLIQIHLEEPDGSNILRFYTKTTKTKNFNFVQNTGIDSSEFRMLNQRLAMRMAS